MITFIGDHTCKMDAKGRVAFPSSFRKQFPQGKECSFVMKKDIFENCLVLYLEEEWHRQNEFFRKCFSGYNRKENRFVRAFNKEVEMVTTDSAGRILIPLRFQVMVGLEKEVVLAGQLDKIEIWSKEQYEQATTLDDFSEFAEKILGDAYRGKEGL